MIKIGSFFAYLRHVSTIIDVKNFTTFTKKLINAFATVLNFIIVINPHEMWKKLCRLYLRLRDSDVEKFTKQFTLRLFQKLFCSNFTNEFC